MILDWNLISIGEAHDFDAKGEEGSVEETIEEEHLAWKTKFENREWKVTKKLISIRDRL